jgi:hypothetical protein
MKTQLDPVPRPDYRRRSQRELRWIADIRTTEALQRQADYCGYSSVKDYLLMTIGTGSAQDDDDTIVTTDDRILCGTAVRLDKNGLP